MRRAMHEALSEEAMADTARMIQEKARAGDLAAAKLLYAYGIGRPTPAVNPDQLDVQELQMHQQAAVSPDSLRTIVDAMPVTVALTLVRGLLPVLEQRAAKQVVDVLENGPPPADDEELDMEPPEEDAGSGGAQTTQPPDGLDAPGPSDSLEQPFDGAKEGLNSGGSSCGELNSHESGCGGLNSGESSYGKPIGRLPKGKKLKRRSVMKLKARAPGGSTPRRPAGSGPSP